MTRRAIGIETARARLAEIERELVRLRYRHDIAMSAFLFEEAAALGRDIAVLNREREALAAELPPSGEPAPATGAVPTLARPRRPRRR